MIRYGSSGNGSGIGGNGSGSRGNGRYSSRDASGSYIISHWPLPAVRDLTRDSRSGIYDESVLKLSKVSFQEKC